MNKRDRPLSTSVIIWVNIAVVLFFVIVIILGGGLLFFEPEPVYNGGDLPLCDIDALGTWQHCITPYGQECVLVVSKVSSRAAMDCEGWN